MGHIGQLGHICPFGLIDLYNLASQNCRHYCNNSIVILACLLNTLEPDYDLVVYGGTSAGVIAAVQARRMGKSVALVCPEKHLGGLSSNGLGYTDTGDKSVIGGLAREFYHRVYLHYQKPEAWRWQKREEYGNKGQGIPAIDGEMRTMWIFEPHVAEGIFEGFIKENQIPVFRDQWLNRKSGVTVENRRIKSIKTLKGITFTAKMFIDASYEGDLMAAARVSYTVGREGTDVYQEKWAGVQAGVRHHRHHFGVLKQGIPARDSKGKLLPYVSAEPIAEQGSGDKKVQAYCYRLCMTTSPENRIPFPKPKNYKADTYLLLLKLYESGWNETFDKFDDIPNHKTDTNNHGPFSSDFIGMSYDYPEASYEKRKQILKAHEDYQKGWLYFLTNDPRVPASVQKKAREYGLPKDEFQDNGGWPHQIYVREARRMVGSYVMTEHELLKERPTPNPVGMGSYGIDSHNVQRYITPGGVVDNEGDIGVSTKGPYQISYGSLLPKKNEIENLAVPVACSSSHVAYGSIRMEPVFMILGQSAATAACLSIDKECALQDLEYGVLNDQLVKDGQVLTRP